MGNLFLLFITFIALQQLSPLINSERGHYIEISDRGLDVLTERYRGQYIKAEGLRSSCNDQTDEVNKLFIIWPFALFLKRMQ